MQSGRILVVEDDDALRRLTQVHLRKCGYTTAVTATAAEALQTLDHDPHDIVISDLHLPGMSGLELLKKIKAKHPETEVVMMTAFATVPTAVEAMKSGAFDYLTKPIHLYELSAVVNRVLERTRLVEEVHLLRHNIDEKYGFQNIIGRSKSLLYVLEQAARVAPTDATVLIQGETGTGKEVLAKSIHFNSPRRERPLVTINCAAIPRDLLESELFGHLRGSFTGAIAHKMGRVEKANGGTLFLDEIGELALDLQVRLLRLIQEREIEKIGATAPTKVDVRVIAATNRDLGALAASGTFREDLYYRLAVVPIEMPPLRNRAEDIPNFVDFFFEVSRQKHGKPKLTLPSSLIPYFIAYRWPGNVRELENTIERIVVLSNGGQVTIDDLPETLQLSRRPRREPNGSSEGVNLQAMERELIFQALRQSHWNQSRAAKSLGITRKTLMYRIAKYRIAREEVILDPAKEALSSAVAGHH
jgi:DNA-binding NtrC family response regulator